MQTNKVTQMSHKEAGRILREHWGASADLARELGLARATISIWLKHGHGLSSEKVAAIIQRAYELQYGIRQSVSTVTERQQDASPVSLREKA